MLTGLTAVYIADIQPFYQSGQIKGIIGGLKGAAEYEKLVSHPGGGTAGMRSQKVVHYMIILFIILGNIAYLADPGEEPLMDATAGSAVWTLLAGVVTLAIFSFLYRDNPLYKTL